MSHNKSIYEESWGKREGNDKFSVLTEVVCMCMRESEREEEGKGRGGEGRKGKEMEGKRKEGKGGEGGKNVLLYIQKFLETKQNKK